MKSRNTQRIKRHQRIRNKIKGDSNRPRLTLFRSNRGVYAQLIDDVSRTTLVGMYGKGKSIQNITAFGTAFGEAVKQKNITTVVFDRSGYLYHGRVKAFADAVRAIGITF